MPFPPIPRWLLRRVLAQRPFLTRARNIVTNLVVRCAMYRRTSSSLTSLRRRRSASADEICVLAFREVQRSRVATEDKVKLFIPASRIASDFGIDDILHAINRESQSSTWDQALSSLCDFVCVKGHGIRFTCTNRDLAIKIGGTAVTYMGQKLIVKL